jgi:hypothetical protein
VRSIIVLRSARPLQEQGLPLRDLIRVAIEPLYQFCHRLFAFDRGKSHFRFEGR